MTPRIDSLEGAAQLIASALSIQVAVALATVTFDSISPAAAAGVSFALAAAALLALRRPRVASWSAERRRDVALLGIAGAVGSAFLYLSVDHLEQGSAVTIEFLGPLAVAVLSARGARVWVASALALLGVALVTGATPEGDLVGVAFALTAALGWGLYVVGSRRVGRYDDPLGSLAVAFCVAALACLPFTAAAAPRLATDWNLGILAAVALLGRVLPYRLELAALRRLRPSTAGVLFSVEPAIAAMVGAAALGQGLAPAQAVGILAVVAAGALVLREVPVGAT